MRLETQIYLLLICSEELDDVTVSCSWSLTFLSLVLQNCEQFIMLCPPLEGQNILNRGLISGVASTAALSFSVEGKKNILKTAPDLNLLEISESWILCSEADM